MSGKFEWIKKDQKRPISCAWSAEKEIGGLQVDVSDGAGHLIKMTMDIPPVELALPRLDVTATDLQVPVKATTGFKMSGDNAGHLEVTFDTTLKGDKPSGPTLTVKGTLEVNCPPKK